MQSTIIVGRIEVEPTQDKQARINIYEMVVKVLGEAYKDNAPKEYFIPCKFIGEKANLITDELKKGTLVSIKANISSNQGKDGKYWPSINVTSIEVLDEGVPF